MTFIINAEIQASGNPLGFLGRGHRYFLEIKIFLHNDFGNKYLQYIFPVYAHAEFETKVPKTNRVKMKFLACWWSNAHRDKEITYDQYPYPQVSGILGFKEILSYSESYGIPTTDFIVKKDILASTSEMKYASLKYKFIHKHTHKHTIYSR